MVPGLISWAIIIGPIWLSFSYPWLVAYFVLSFDFYWVCRALWFAGAVIVAFGRIREVLAADWPAAVRGLEDRGARQAALRARLAAASRAPDAALGVVAGAVRPSGTMERRALRRELAELERVDREGLAVPAAAAYVQLALIPTYTESAREAARHGPRPRRCRLADGAQDLRDHHPRDRRGRDRERQAPCRPSSVTPSREFIHILDPLEPGIVIGKSSAMAWGGR